MAKTIKTPREGALEFAVILGLVLGFLAYAWHTGLWHFEQRPGRANGVLLAIPIIAIVALFIKSLWQIAYDWWMKFAEALGFVVTRIILTVFYFVVMTPIGLFMRMIGRKPLDLAWKDGASSYWIEKKPAEATIERYQKQF